MIMIDINRHSSALGVASSTLTSEPEHINGLSFSPPIHRRPSGFLSRSGLSFSATSASSNMMGLSRAPSFSSTAAKFKSLSKYRSRRLSQDSLTDLSPPTHPDLDLIAQPRSASSIRTEEALESPPSVPNHRSSVIFLGRSAKLTSSSHKPFKDSKPSSGNMILPKPDASHPLSLRLRLLPSKSATEARLTDSDKSSIPKYQVEHSLSRSLKPSVLRSIHHKVTKSEVLARRPVDSDEFEAIKSPSNNGFRQVMNRNSPHRPSIHSVSQTWRGLPARELNRSSSSPNLNLAASTFSQRPSQDSERGTQVIGTSFDSPKRSKPPPPIKVPHRAGYIAIAIGNDSSSVTPSKIPPRHHHSSSESIGQSFRRVPSVHWFSSVKQLDSKTSVNQVNETLIEANSRTASCEDLTMTAARARNLLIPISSCSSKANKDKFPVVMPLQPAPRRLPGPHLHSSTAPKGGTLPLLVSKHSRSLCNENPSSQHRPISSIIPGDTSSNASCSPERLGEKNLQLSKRLTSVRLSQCPQSPKYNSSSLEQRASLSPEEASDQHEKLTSARRSFSPARIPFPTSEKSVRAPLSLTLIASSPNDGDSCCPRDNPIDAYNEKAMDQMENLNKSPDGIQTGSVASFDIRSFPLHLDTTAQTPESTSSVAIPESAKISQIVSESMTTQLVSNPALSLPGAETRLFDENISSPIASGISNGSIDALNSANRIFTPSSISLSHISSSLLSRATSYQSIKSKSQSSTRRHNVGLSVDDFYVNINSNVLMDFSRRKAKKLRRPRSMSDSEPSSDDIWTRLFRDSKEVASTETESPYSSDCPLFVLPCHFRAYSPRSPTIVTQSIEQQIRASTPSELNKIIQDALQAYNSDAHRFIVGDVNQLIREAKLLEEKAKGLHLRYLNDARQREIAFDKHIIALQVFNPDQGFRLGESLCKRVTQADQVALELLDSINYSSKVNRMCEAHWRAAAAVQLNNLAVKEAQLEAAQSRIERLESERARHVKKIADLQTKLDLLQYQARPSSVATDADSADSIGSGSIHSTNMPFASTSPSSTPRFGHFPFNGTLRHGKIVHSRMRLSSANSFSSALNSNPLLEAGMSDGVGSNSSGEPVSPRTAFLSSYRLAHSHAVSLEQSETLSQAVNKAPPQTDKPNTVSIATPSLQLNTFANYSRSDNSGSARNNKLGGLVLRHLFPNNNTIKQKRPINGLHLKSNRSSSFGSSDVQVVGLDSKPASSLAPCEGKPRSLTAISSVLQAAQPPSWALHNNGTNSTSELSSIDGFNEFQQSSVTSRGASSSSLLRFPRQVPPPPSLPLPSEWSRRRTDWSTESSGIENLSSITLSQLGSMDIAKLINNLDSSER